MDELSDLSSSPVLALQGNILWQFENVSTFGFVRLCHLPASKHWKYLSEPLVSEVCRLEYKVVNLEDILDDEDDEPRFITDVSERTELEAIRLSSPIFCIPPTLRVPLGCLLQKVSYMHDDEERGLDCLLEYSYECLVALAVGQAVTPRFLEVLEVLQRTPIWAAYLRRNRGNRLSRNTRTLVNLPLPPYGFPSISQIRAQVNQDCPSSHQ